MTTPQILNLDETRDNGRRRADERLVGNRYVLARDKGKPRQEREKTRTLREVVT